MLRQRLFNICRLRASLNAVQQRRTAASSGRPGEQTQADAGDPEDAPLPFSTSGAASWRARDTFGGGAEEDDVPWYQMPSVLLSTAALLVYFCVLREESDIDERLSGGQAGAMDQVPGLERQTLQAYIRHQELAGRSADRERARLLQLEQAQRDGTAT